jgi:DNA-binding response OmpR family regulator
MVDLLRDKIMSGSTRILMYGSDPTLLESRALILERANFEVCAAYTHDDFIEMLNTRDVSLCILCHSLSVEQGLKALTFAQEVRPDIKILSMLPELQSSPEGRHVEILDQFVEPRILIAVVLDLLNLSKISRLSA